MADAKRRTIEGERTIVRDMCFIGISWGGNACMVDVKDGKVLRIRPARFYDEYTKDEVKPWVMRARGRTFDPGEKTLPPPFSIAYKKRVFSPARIRYPMKRVDFDPTGAPVSVGNINSRHVTQPFDSFQIEIISGDATVAWIEVTTESGG